VTSSAHIVEPSLTANGGKYPDDARYAGYVWGLRKVACRTCLRLSATNRTCLLSLATRLLYAAFACLNQTPGKSERAGSSFCSHDK
jgi:hypothetical protein